MMPAMRRALVLVVLASPFGARLEAQLDQLGPQIGQLGRKTAVSSIRITTDPATPRVRPFETLVVQVRAYAKTEDGQDARLRRAGARVKAREAGGGWISKPFVFQGTDEEKFADESKSAAWNIFVGASGQFVNKDAFLYTAPEKPGKYNVDAELEGHKASVEIEVAADAASVRAAERVAFLAEPALADPYRPLAEHYAPMLAQETWFQPKSDIPTRFDFDGDWRGDNNWENLDAGTSQAYVYYTAMETATHWFLIYNVFHPRDYSDKCAVGTCHENDNEGLILTVRKDGSRFGRLQTMETLAHNNIYSATADRAVRDGEHRIDGEIEFHEGTHPIVFIESGGHGIYGSRLKESRYNRERDEFLDGTGITFVYKGAAERARHANDRLVGYELLPIYQHWWVRAREDRGAEATFDSFFRYQPFGGRPGIPYPIGGAFLGRTEASNKAKPFWGWHDSATLKRGVLAVGQWGLDPAYSASRNLRFPPPFSLDYTYNPYLGIGQPAELPEATGVIVTQAPVVTAPSQTPAAAFDPGASLAAGLESPRTSATPPVALPSSPSPAATTAAAGFADIEAQIDGTVDVILALGMVRFDVVSGGPVARGQWSFSGPMPASATWSLSKSAGRGTARLVESPSAANGGRAVIRVEDPRGGSDTYKLRLDWR
jgi:hypothetical protein